MNTFLFELGTEEIPASMIPPALDQMRQGFEKTLEENQIRCESLKIYSTPRRLAILLAGLPDQQPDREEVVLGPPKNVAMDAGGNPTKAGEGFARKSGVTFDQLEIVETSRGQYVGHRKKLPGKPVPEILRNALPDLIASISWPKNMYWRETRFRFIRPLRWYVALWNRDVVDFEFEAARSGRATRGHRFLGQPSVEIASPDEYVKKLRENFVLVDVEERKKKIVHELEQQTPPGLCLISDPELLESVVHLNEYPTVLRGSFDRSFLHIPKEVLITVMRHHQKYFSLVNEQQELEPYFLTVLNTKGDPDGSILKGHEKVLRARLEDAAFFWQSDQKIALKDRVQLLKDILFQEKLGSYRDKTERVRAICRELSDESNLDSAALLCKADLTTDMVREFTELQGIMGGLYARQEGYPEEVWKAIYEHYKPASLEDEPPSTREGARLSMADKLDTIVGCFGVDIIPTGSSDPFALRRQGQGLIKILLDHRLDYPLGELVVTAQKNFSLEKPADQTRREVVDFLERRVRFIFQEKGIPYDVLNAVMAIGVERIHSAHDRAVALVKMRGEPDLLAVAAAYKRIKNILSNQAIDLPAVLESELVEAEEIGLYRAFKEVEAKVEKDLKTGHYVNALKEIAGLRRIVDRFFDKVLVLTGDDRLRKNRLRLLHDISQLFLRIADISELVVTETVSS